MSARIISQPNGSQQACVFISQHVSVENQQPKERPPNFGDLTKMIPPFKDYLNNLHTYQYLQQLEHSETMQAKHNEITQQYSSSTDEGCETDHGGNNKSRIFNYILHIYA